ncbi:Inositol-pentakisphosphate 2-kinase [Haplosporangium bisporale]|nr:Inositol-pentakisphosphate 2-kinase [Haplosporangium bisporale]
MASYTELYVVEHWRYRAEGNANLVLQYVGPNPAYATTVLRLRKAERPDATNASESDLRASVPGPATRNNISSESQFASQVIGRLLGQEYVEQLIAVQIPQEFIQELAVAIEPSRPVSRRQKGIDHSQKVGFLALDHTRFITSTEHPSVSVEIKPKWGFLTNSDFVRKDQDIKKRKCRFCMYQHHKILSGIEQDLSLYCPIDLFSGQELLVHDALESLVQTPQNNLRLFVEGVQQTVTPSAMKVSLTKEPLEARKRDDEEYPTIIDVLSKILVNSTLLERLARLQLSLDSLDIETIHQFYVHIANPTDNSIPEPTFDEYMATAEAFLERTDINGLMSDMREVFVTQNASSLGFGPEDSLEDVPDTLKLHFIREFLLSATLKDCSILMTVRRLDDHPPTSTASEDVLPSFKENARRIKVGGSEFEYKMTCIDLDPKKMSSVPKYLKKDREIVEHYLSSVGDREKSCGTN